MNGLPDLFMHLHESRIIFRLFWNRQLSDRSNEPMVVQYAIACRVPITRLMMQPLKSRCHLIEVFQLCDVLHGQLRLLLEILCHGAWPGSFKEGAQ